MGNSYTVYLLYKIMDQMFINNFANGNFYFSCCGNWIDIAKRECDNGQGDKHEGVFAKYKKKNSRKPKKYYRALFKNDLIIEQEGDYILFKRKSSLYIPAICFYSIDNQTIKDNMPDDEKKKIENVASKGINSKRISVNNCLLPISENYRTDFELNSESKDAVLIQPRDVLTKLEEHGVFYKKVTYIDMSNEFDIFKDKLYTEYFTKVEDAIDKHIEIFFKDKTKYSHQCELRGIIYNEQLTSIKKGKTISLEGLKRIDIPEHTTPDDEILNATGIDFICNVKNIVLRGGATFERLID